MNTEACDTSITVQSRRAGLMSLELLKYAGFLLMLADHANRYLWSLQHPWMEQAGRLVFPFFAFVLGVGLRNSRDPVRLSVRLALLAVLAEVSCWLLVFAGQRDFVPFTVVVTLLAGVVLVLGVRCWGDGQRFGGALLVVGAFALSWWSEYGPPGAAMVWAAWSGRWWLVLLVLGLLGAMQGTAMPLLVPAFVLAAHVLGAGDRATAPRLLFGAGYVLQFLVFGALALWTASPGAA